VTFDGAQTYTKAGEVRVYKKNITLNPIEFTNDNLSTIVAYGDITITGDLNLADSVRPKAIIALADEAGNGGNIYIQSNIRRLDLSLVAQGTIFSGEGGGTPRYYAQEATASGTLKNQLYIFGSVISANTIG
jgi:uncharacterized protein YaiI (UPF0178 family)